MSQPAPMRDMSGAKDHAWRAALTDLALQCSCAEPDEAGQLLSELHALLQAAPAGNAWLTAGLPSAARIAALLRSDAALSAAGALIEHRAGYMLSQGPGGRAMATLVLVGSAAETSCSAGDPALALAGALAEALSTAYRVPPPATRYPPKTSIRSSTAPPEYLARARLN